MRPTVTWVLLATTREARLYENRGPGKGLVALGGLAMTAAPARTYSDEPGVGHSSVGPGRAAVDQGDPQADADARFAGEVAEALDAALGRHDFDRLILAAGPTMLGLLRKALTDRVRDTVADELDKDLTALAPRDLEKRIGKVMTV